MDVGLRGVFFAASEPCSRCWTQEPVAEARGRIINLSSQHWHGGERPATSPTARPREAWSTWTRQLAVDFGRRGVMVNAIAPGKIMTAPLDEYDTDEILAYSHARTPFSRLGPSRGRGCGRGVPGLR